MPNEDTKATASSSLTMDEINANAKHDLCEAMDRMTNAFSTITNDSSNKLDIRAIEDMMTSFISETQKISLDAMSDMLSSFDEREIIESKKESVKKEG